MRFLRFVLVFGCLLTCTTLMMGKASRTQIADAINRCHTQYPEAHLRDVYKSFFQDRFGPGHIIVDSLSAARYLQREIESYSHSDYSLYEPTGAEANYYRVSLDVVKRGLVSPQLLVSALLRSAIPPSVSPQEWENEWHEVMSVIAEKGIVFDDADADLQAIETALQNTPPMMHHSTRYNEAYNPHYRIIARDIFLSEILPLIENRSEQ